MLYILRSTSSFFILRYVLQSPVRRDNLTLFFSEPVSISSGYARSSPRMSVTESIWGGGFSLIIRLSLTKVGSAAFFLPLHQGADHSNPLSKYQMKNKTGPEIIFNGISIYVEIGLVRITNIGLLYSNLKCFLIFVLYHFCLGLVFQNPKSGIRLNTQNLPLKSPLEYLKTSIYL
jgi:hypothetical protein